MMQHYYEQTVRRLMNKVRHQCPMDRLLNLFYTSNKSGASNHRKLSMHLILISLLFFAMPAYAIDYIFPNKLPLGCIDNGNGSYSCAALTLVAGDTITIAAPKPATITFSGAFVIGAGVFINADGNTSDLTLVVHGAVTMGAGSLLNANLQTLGAGAITIGANSWIGGNVSTETGYVSIGAATTPPPAPPTPQQTGVGGKVSTITGYVLMGAGSVINGSVTTQSAGYAVLGANAKVSGSISTLGAGYVTLGAGAQVTGSITVSGTTGADYVTTGVGAVVGCGISTAGSYIVLGASTKVGGNVSTKVGYITVGASCMVSGQLSMNDPTPSYISIGASSKVYAVCCNGSGTSCVTDGSGITPGPLVCVVPNGSTGSQCVGSTPSNSLAANFECLETGASYNNLVSNNSLRNPLYTKLAGTSFKLDLVALKTDGTIEKNYASASNKNISLELVDGSGTTACATRAAIAPAVSQILTLAAGDAGRKSAVGMTVSNAYANLRCRITDANQSPSIVGCSTDNFSVRPSSLTLTTSAIAVPPSSNSTPAFNVGSNFSIGAITTSGVNYAGILSLDNSKLTAQNTAQDSTIQVGGIVGVITPSMLTANANMVNASYTEVGYVYLAAGAFRDESFTQIDSLNGDCILDKNADNNLSDTLSNGMYGCHIGNKTAVSLGRFYPDHFAISASVLNAGCSSDIPFTYFGQDGLTTKFTLTAQNALNSTTQNYEGAFAKLDPTNYSSYFFSASALPSGSSLSSSAIAPTGAWSKGAVNVSAKHQISRPTKPEAETLVTISASPSDGEVNTNKTSSVVSDVRLRYGRLKMTNVYGSELLNLPIPLEAQYWNGLNYMTNQQDSCTLVPASSLTMSNFKNNLTACETQLNYTSGQGVLKNGVSSLFQLTKPGSKNNGSVDLRINLNAPNGNTCTSSTISSATSAGLPWFGNDPISRATFGIYKTPMIYMRENF